jgi:anthranilate synthase component 2
MSAEVLILDNYDSFVFNLARYLEELGQSIRVVRNDALSVDDALACRPAAIVLSPGPCAPAQAGICVELIQAAAGQIPILGVCLGHQAIVAAYGGDVVRAVMPVHGRRSSIWHGGSRLLAGCDNPLSVGRYHSLAVREETLPEELIVTARTRDGTVMAVEHRSDPVFGTQFHPESILTHQGHLILANFLRAAGLAPSGVAASGEVTVPVVEEDDFYRREIEPGGPSRYPC